MKTFLSCLLLFCLLSCGGDKITPNNKRQAGMVDIDDNSKWIYRYYSVMVEGDTVISEASHEVVGIDTINGLEAYLVQAAPNGEYSGAIFSYRIRTDSTGTTYRNNNGKISFIKYPVSVGDSFAINPNEVCNQMGYVLNKDTVFSFKGYEYDSCMLVYVPSKCQNMSSNYYFYRYGTGLVGNVNVAALTTFTSVLIYRQ